MHSCTFHQGRKLSNEAGFAVSNNSIELFRYLTGYIAL
jgi:hypothetical protein